MITALDTNLLSGLWGANEEAGRAAGLLDACQTEGALLVFGAVYAELQAHPRLSQAQLGEFLESYQIGVDFATGPEIWQLAGAAFASYAERRRRAGHGAPKRLLADFIIGAHAQLRADRLATLDRRRYATAFPRLRIVEP